MQHFKDQLGRSLYLKERPSRIVSLVPSQTELLVDLQLEARVLGVTKFCVHPPRLRKEKLVVGGTKTVNFEKIRSLRPEIILCNKEENTREMVEELEKIAPVHVSDIRSIEDTLELITQYGELFGVAARAEALRARILEAQLDFRELVKELPVLKVAYFIWKDPWMVAGGDTFIDHLLQLNKFENVFQGAMGRYPVIAPESLKETGVELLLLSTEPFPFREEHVNELGGLPEGCGVRIVDGEAFSWYGSRLLAAFAYFKSLRAS